MPARRRTAFWVCIALGTAAIGVGGIYYATRHPAGARPIRIGYLPIVGDLPVFVAAERGYLSGEGLQFTLTELRSGNEAANALLAGQTDVQATLGVTTLLPLAEKAPGRLKVIYSAVERPGTRSSAILVRKDNPAQTISSLRGLKIGTYSGLTQLQTLRLILERHLDPREDVEIIQVEPRLQVQAFAAGQYQALFTIEPYVTIAVRQGVARVLESDPRAREIVSPFWAAGTTVSAVFAQQRTADIARLRRALDRAVRSIEAEEKSARALLTKYTPLEPALAQEVGLYQWTPLGGENRRAFSELAEKMKRAGMIQRLIDASEVFYAP